MKDCLSSSIGIPHGNRQKKGQCYWKIAFSLSLTDHIFKTKCVMDKLRVAGVMKNKLRAKRGVYFHDSGDEEFIKLIVLFFRFAQRVSFLCDTQKQDSVVTRLN